MLTSYHLPSYGMNNVAQAAQPLPSWLDAAPRISGVLDHLFFFPCFFGVSLSKTSAPWVIVMYINA